MKTGYSIAFLLLLSLGGCTASVGDACTVSTDCGTSMSCERSLPEGYCTRENCTDTGCPDGGVCVSFSLDENYCMELCDVDSDCRDAYRCVTGFGPHPFCGDVLGVNP
jgi:hypothetical protein